MELVRARLVIMFNVSDVHIDTFIITRQSIKVMDLPLLTSNELKETVVRFQKAVSNHNFKTYSSSQSEFKTVLK